MRAGLDPGYMVGGEVHGAQGGAAWGQGPWLVVEADESDGTFLRLGAQGAVVTNVEADHLDHYGTEEALARAFRTFLEQAPGPRVVCLDDPGAAALAAAVPGVTTYGTSAAAAYRIERAELSPGATRFDVSAQGKPMGTFELPVPGLHNVRNAVAALATAVSIGVGPEVAREALAAYTGVGRRFEWRGARDGVSYVDDYAHLPSEVQATLAAARQGGWERVVAVFQPHRYSRTAALGRDFGGAFGDADVVVVTGIYPAGRGPAARRDRAGRRRRRAGLAAGPSGRVRRDPCRRRGHGARPAAARRPLPHHGGRRPDDAGGPVVGYAAGLRARVVRHGS